MRGLRILTLALFAILIGGCETAKYQGYSPSYRTMNDHADVKDYYVGLNFKYAVDKPTEYRPAQASATPTIPTTMPAQASLSND